MSDTLIQLHSPRDIGQELARRAKHLRLLKGWKQATLAARSGVTLASLKRFETTGKVSLESLLRICHALGRLDEFNLLLHPPAARLLDELEALVSRPSPRRGRQ